MNSVAVIAGSISTALFVASTLPMLYKAARTKELGSYSLGYLALANVGNGFYTVYVISLPVGPIWALHGFYLVSSALMLLWYLRYEVSKRFRLRRGVDGATQSSRGRGSVAAWACCTWRLLQHCRCGPLDCLVLEPG
jgi:hypothetical protein